MFLTSRYFRFLFQGLYIDFDKQVGFGLIFLTVPFCLVFNNISLKFDEVFTSFFIKLHSLLIISSTSHLCHGEIKYMLEIAFYE